MTEATLTMCRECGELKISAAGIAMRARTVPGTGDSNCGHLHESAGTVDITRLVHVALSTIIRADGVEASQRDTAHVIQEWLRLPERSRTNAGLPWSLARDYGVSAEGLAIARILARAMSAVTVPSEAYYWQAAANVMRRRI